MRNWSCKQRTRPQSGSMFVGGVVLSGRVNMSNWKSIRSRFRLLCTEPVRDLTCFSLTCSLGRIKFMELRYYWRHLIQRKALNITIVWINSWRWIDFMQFYLNDCFDFSFLFFFSLLIIESFEKFGKLILKYWKYIHSIYHQYMWQFWVHNIL